MRLAVVLVLVAASAGSQFVSPRASADGVTNGTMAVDLSVTLSGSDGPVVAHLMLPGQEPEVTPLIDRGGGEWGMTLDLRRADWLVVFEDVSSGVLSEEWALTSMGLDPSVLGIVPPAAAAEPRSRVPPPAMAAAAAVAVVAFSAVVAWRLTPRRHPPPPRRPRSGRS